MAKATKETREEQVMVTKEVTVVTLEMTEDEADILSAVLHMVSGNPGGPRGKINSILDALCVRGYNADTFKDEYHLIDYSLIEGNVHFK